MFTQVKGLLAPLVTTLVIPAGSAKKDITGPMEGLQSALAALIRPMAFLFNPPDALEQVNVPAETSRTTIRRAPDTLCS